MAQLDSDNHEEVHAAAREVKCPRCGAGPRLACQTARGRFMEGYHAERLSAAVGGPSKENRPHPGRRQYQQRQADPTLRVIAGTMWCCGCDDWVDPINEARRIGPMGGDGREQRAHPPIPKCPNEDGTSGHLLLPERPSS